MWRRQRWRAWQILRPPDQTEPRFTRLSRRFDVFILSLIALNVALVVVGTVERVQALAGPFLYGFEVFSVIVFTVEYVARLWACVEADDYDGRPVRYRLRFALTPLALVDLLAVLPFYLPMLGVDLRFTRALRLMRIFRLAKVGRYAGRNKYVAAFRLFAGVLRRKKEDLLVVFSFLGILLVMAASVMYYAEHEVQPEVFSSIPAAAWWAVVTLTTVGYGDTYPVTGLGQFVAGIVALLGIGLFALPTGILASGFEEALEMRRARRAQGDAPKTCPHCEAPLHCAQCGSAIRPGEDAASKQAAHAGEDAPPPEE